MEAYSERSKAGDARRQDEAVAKMVEEHGAMLKKILDKLSEADTPAQQEKGDWRGAGSLTFCFA